MNILVVDDEVFSKIKLQKIMSGFGTCEAAESGSEAINAFKKALENGSPFDLITLDIIMPEMDGIEVLMEIREIEKARNVPKENQVKILMVSSHSDKDNLTTCFTAGCNDYIVKPFDRRMVLEKLEKMESGKTVNVAEIEHTKAAQSNTRESKLKILVVDDEVFSRMKLQKIMSSFGKCEAAESGSQAINAFKKALENGTPFDLITLDIIMPVMDGIEVLMEIREIEKARNVPKEKQVKILMVSSRSDKDNITTSLTAGCNDYIVKPFDRGMIVDQLVKIGLNQISV